MNKKEPYFDDRTPRERFVWEMGVYAELVLILAVILALGWGIDYLLKMILHIG